MSEATLKKKTFAQYNQCHSSGYGFSLNGTHRNMPYVGQSSARTYGRTPFKGALPKGHGGCCGFYGGHIVKAPTPYADSPSLPKQTVMNTSGMLANRFKWTHGGVYPNYWVDPRQQHGDYAGTKPMKYGTSIGHMNRCSTGSGCVAI